MNVTYNDRPEQRPLTRTRGRAAIWLITSWRQTQDAWAIFSRNWMAMLGLFILVAFVLAAIIYPILMETVWPFSVYNPNTGYDMAIFPHPSPPGPGHLLGTDTLGRDVLSVLLAATGPSLTLAFTAALTTALISTAIGIVSAYYGGWVDKVFAHIADVMMLLPAPLVMVVLGATMSLTPVVFGLLYGLLAGVSAAAIVMRNYALTVFHKPYIEAARVAGSDGFHIMWKHMLPHLVPLSAMTMMLNVVGAVFADGFSAFMGISRIRHNWGQMIYGSFMYQRLNPTITWNVLIPSALAISFFAMSFYLIARGLQQVAEPRMRE